MVDTRSGKDHSANPPPTKRSGGRRGQGGQLEVVIEAPAQVLNKAQEDAIAIFRATKAAYLNAKNYDEMDLLKSYLEQFLPWKEILANHLDGWNPYTERKHIKVLENNKQPTKESKERDPKKPVGIEAEPYERKPKKSKNKWKETFRMSRVLMEVKNAIEE
ncbi:hypothetical protein PTTG_10509 [Puccinia triticina 1-1 BBBD Race 1]|uniref:Uncharacterized protein n=1 Tax=Puccinia triticina (isolate 1-1 / race 1 (BBBD)) TaxID=630390 RepID=A0A180G1B0_PUCT1|nr:hypothetical protein PTTG_10509 [Puccinia triticina 1-1 BBBD Race 1]